ncbi:MAG: hypothetical protein M1284_02855 [Candidatus Parvarchaeota archaeon]|jgi:hypothetical protein|nr:hypothetical protein [Candidatus Parvarchaeota archaeon]
MVIRKSVIFLIVVVLIAAVLFIVLKTQVFAQSKFKVFNLNNVYFSYPKNWSIVSYHYNATSKLTFNALLLPTNLVSTLSYPNGSIRSLPNTTNFSEISIIILKNKSLSELYPLYIFNYTYLVNNTVLDGYRGAAAVEEINASSLLPKSEAISYISSGGGYGYSVGAFLTLGFNKSTYGALTEIIKTFKYPLS